MSNNQRQLDLLGYSYIYVMKKLLILLLFCGCVKENEPIVVDVPISRGAITFYVHMDDYERIELPVSIFINDSLIGELNGVPIGKPNCLYPTTLGKRVNLDYGTYKYKALSENWGDSAFIQVDYECELIRLE